MCKPKEYFWLQYSSQLDGVVLDGVAQQYSQQISVNVDENNNIWLQLCAATSRGRNQHIHSYFLEENQVDTLISMLSKCKELQEQKNAKVLELSIYNDYKKMIESGVGKGDAALKLQEIYKRGRFSIKNILDKYGQI